MRVHIMDDDNINIRIDNNMCKMWRLVSECLCIHGMHHEGPRLK